MSSLFKKKIRTPVSIPVPIVGNPRELPCPDDVRFVHLGIIVGHTEKTPGAKSITGFTEYSYNSDVAAIIAKLAKSNDKLKVSIIKRDGVGIAGAYEHATELRCDAVVELHFNDFNGLAFGTETLCSSDMTDIEFAHEIHSAVCDAFNRDGMSRGVKVLSRSSRGAENIYSFPNGVNCLVEPFFGDHPDDVEKAARLKQEYAEAIIAGVILWAKKNDLI